MPDLNSLGRFWDMNSCPHAYPTELPPQLNTDSAEGLSNNPAPLPLARFKWQFYILKILVSNVFREGLCLQQPAGLSFCAGADGGAFTSDALFPPACLRREPDSPEDGYVWIMVYIYYRTSVASHFGIYSIGQIVKDFLFSFDIDDDALQHEICQLWLRKSWRVWPSDWLSDEQSSIIQTNRYLENNAINSLWQYVYF